MIMIIKDITLYNNDNFTLYVKTSSSASINYYNMDYELEIR